MRRRDFLPLVGTLTGAWPLAVHAQQKAMPVIGWLSSISAATQGVTEGGTYSPSSPVAAFHAGLRDAGYVEGRALCGVRDVKGKALG